MTAKYINTEAIKQKVLTMYNTGKLDVEIEKKLKFPPGTIYNYRKKHNLPSNRGKQAEKNSKLIANLIRKGYTAKEISKITKINTYTLREYFRRNNMLELRNVKRKIGTHYVFSKRQLTILCGILLGDGTLYCQNKTCRFIVRHGPKQKRYSEYIYYCFLHTNCSIKCISIKNNILNNKLIKEQQQSEVRINSSKKLTELKAIFYKNNKKIIPFDFLNKYYTKEALAFHFMDDGSKTINQNTGEINGFIFSMQSFTIKEVENFSYFLLGRFNLISNVYLQNNMPILKIKKCSVNTFINIVKPYIIDSLKYKICPNKTS